MEVTTDPDAFEEVKNALEVNDLTFVQAKITMIPQPLNELTGDDLEKMIKLIGTLEDDDAAVQGVYYNLDSDEVFDFSLIPNCY